MWRLLKLVLLDWLEQMLNTPRALDRPGWRTLCKVVPEQLEQVPCVV